MQVHCSFLGGRKAGAVEGGWRVVSSPWHLWYACVWVTVLSAGTLDTAQQQRAKARGPFQPPPPLRAMRIAARPSRQGKIHFPAPPERCAQQGAAGKCPKVGRAMGWASRVGKDQRQVGSWAGDGRPQGGSLAPFEPLWISCSSYKGHVARH